jgi:AraC-like DNA-binding protein
MRHRYPDADPPGLVDLTYFPPPESLKEYFGPAYLFTADKPAVSDVTRADFAQLRFMLAGTGDYHFHDGRTARTFDCCLLGPTMGATRFQVEGPLQAFGVSILPLGWAALHLGDASDLADGVADMNAILSPGSGALLTAMRSMDDPGQAPEPLWRLLASCLRPMSATTNSFIRICDAWLAGEPSPRVEALVQASGLSARQVARYANRVHGAPPKYLARKFRALRCAADVALDKQDWMEKVDGVFYDQSHFIREVKHFVGLTPHQLKTEPTDVARLTLQRRAMVGSVAEINRIS